MWLKIDRYFTEGLCKSPIANEVLTRKRKIMPVNSFLGVFAKSPLKPLEDHINLVHKCSQGLLPFFNAVYEQDWKTAQEQQKLISSLEKSCNFKKFLPFKSIFSLIIFIFLIPLCIMA